MQKIVGDSMTYYSVNLLILFGDFKKLGTKQSSNICKMYKKKKNAKCLLSLQIALSLFVGLPMF